MCVLHGFAIGSNITLLVPPVTTPGNTTRTWPSGCSSAPAGARLCRGCAREATVNLRQENALVVQEYPFAGSPTLPPPHPGHRPREARAGTRSVPRMSCRTAVMPRSREGAVCAALRRARRVGAARRRRRARCHCTAGSSPVPGGRQ